MWSFFIQRNRFSYLLLVIIIAIGTFCITSISRESTPEVQVPVGIVTTVLPGAPAAEVESLVTNTLEGGLIGTLENVNEVSSRSAEGVSSITVEFNASANIDDSIDELDAAVKRLQSELPANAEESVVSEVDFVDQPIMSIAVSSPLTPAALRALANDVETVLESVSGVSRVTITGVAEREITVLLDNQLLTQYAITPQQVTNAVRAANQALPVGTIETDGVLYAVTFEGDIDTPAMIGATPVTERGGTPVYVSDLGVVYDDLATATTYSRLSTDNTPSEQSFTLDVYKQSGGDITATAAAVRDELATLQTTLLADAQVELLYDSGQDIVDDLVQLSSSGLQTIILVMIVLVIAIGWREALIAGTAIPLSFLFGFIGLYFSGNTINFLSLFSLILGIGILVDSGIVVVEGINRRMKERPDIDKKEAAIATVREFAAPLAAGTMTTVAMFSGLFIVSGVTGQFIAVIPFTLVFVLLASLVVALIFLPLLSASFLKRRNRTKFEQLQTEYTHRLEAWYKRKLTTILTSRPRQKRFMWSLRGLLVVAILLPVLGVVQVIFFESGDVPFVYVEAELPAGTPLYTTDLLVREVEERLYNRDYIDAFQVTVGAGSVFGSQGSGERVGNVFVKLADERTLSSSEIVTELQAAMADITDGTISVSQPSDGPPTGAAINLRFIGEDITQLADTANQAALQLRNTAGVASVSTAANNSTTEYVLTFKPAVAAQYGLTVQDVSSQVRTAVYGTEATSLTSLTDETAVIIKQQLSGTPGLAADSSNLATIEDIERLELLTPTGATVSVGNVVDVTLRESRSAINHIDGDRVFSVSADVTEGGDPRAIQAAFVSSFSESLPDGVTLSTGGGETEESNRAFVEMFVALLAGILLMLAVLVLQFNSYRHTRYVLSILPYSLIGILFGLAITQNSLSFPSLMGFIALSGIVVNNSILLIDIMNYLRKQHPEMSIEDVVTEAATNRLRPILLTTVTTVIGMIPLTYADDIWAPLAYAVMFGLLFSVVITLVLIPVVYHNKPGDVLQ
jgi:multidrug efflux pump subunit AcrB